MYVAGCRLSVFGYEFSKTAFTFYSFISFCVNFFYFGSVKIHLNILFYFSAEECAADEKVSDIVPIAVGVALASLIIVVLIAYLVGRRRSRQKGYQSV